MTNWKTNCQSVYLACFWMFHLATLINFRQMKEIKKGNKSFFRETKFAWLYNQ